jgi:hypothetical protein
MLRVDKENEKSKRKGKEKKRRGKGERRDQKIKSTSEDTTATGIYTSQWPQKLRRASGQSRGAEQVFIRAKNGIFLVHPSGPFHLHQWHSI